VDKPQNLGARGETLWDNVTAATDFDAAGYALLEDACRTADIIDNLEYMLRADEGDWLRVIEKSVDADQRLLVLNIAPLLGEIRQQRLAMRQLMSQLGIAKAGAEEDDESKSAKDFWTAKENEFNK
jgi:hypothetical protein